MAEYSIESELTQQKLLDMWLRKGNSMNVVWSFLRPSFPNAARLSSWVPVCTPGHLSTKQSCFRHAEWGRPRRGLPARGCTTARRTALAWREANSTSDG